MGRWRKWRCYKSTAASQTGTAGLYGSGAGREHQAQASMSAAAGAVGIVAFIMEHQIMGKVIADLATSAASATLRSRKRDI